MKAETQRGGRCPINSHALNAFRQVRGKTLAELAAEVGVHDSFVSRLERGERQTCTPELAEGLARALDVPMTALLAAPSGGR
ncbi:helix-turn-helix domain-containing protein [Herbidospora daliensis]|uniref:helix-turn-helix domain-containing protein n=1 Tax=Herbidospora daliensis TaxID=295585 RepID=UPI0007806DAC|nr:helix-turn-helix transcriptional regulator [Herbidospora daliensis]